MAVQRPHARRATGEPGTRRLAVPATPLVDRKQELAVLRRLLLCNTVRLVTLHATAGAGKTRLALEVAHEVRHAFAHGVCFVDLAPVRDPCMVATTIAHALGLREPNGRAPLEALTRYLRQKRLLLVLDNFEQVLAAAPVVSELLVASAHLKVLVTSREWLHVTGEHLYPVRPLDVPSLDALSPAEELQHSGAIVLFVQRAQGANPDFRLTDENARAVAEICVRLDGLPLAIELAAARIHLLSPQAMLTRLENRLALLTRGPRNVPARHQSLRGALDWSYELLSPPEQALFRRLAVFTGGCTLQAAAAVGSRQYAVRSKSATDPDTTCGAAEGNWLLTTDNRLQSTAPCPLPAVPEGIEALVEKSLVEREETADGEPRVRILATIREYALERLVESRELDDASRRHARFFLALAEAAEGELTGRRQVEWLNRLERDYGNLRAALAWALEHEEIELGLRLAGALWLFWLVRGHVREGREWLGRFLVGEGPHPLAPSPTPPVPPYPLAPSPTLGRGGTTPAARSVSVAVRARALFVAGFLAADEDVEAEHRFYEASYRLWEQLGDNRGRAWCLLGQARVAFARGNVGTARARNESAFGLFQKIGDAPGIAWSLTHLGRTTRRQGDVTAARAHLEAALEAWRNVGDCWGYGEALRILANEAYVHGDYARAAALYDENLLHMRRLGFKAAIAWSLNAKGDVLRCLEDYEAAGALYEESLALFRELGIGDGTARSAHNLGHTMLHRGDARTAAELFAESLAAFRELDDKAGIAACLMGLAGAAHEQAQPERAARLLGAADVLLASAGALLEPADRIICECYVKATRASLDAATFREAWAAGMAMPLPAAIDYALHSSSSVSAPLPEETRRAPARTRWARVTEREVEVLRLAAEGRSNREIAAALVIDRRTVESHLTHIGKKLGLHRRAVVAKAREIVAEPLNP